MKDSEFPTVLAIGVGILCVIILAAIGTRHIIARFHRDLRAQEVSAVFANTSMKAGDVISADNLREERASGKTFRSGDITADRIPEIVGRKLKRNVPEGNVLNDSDIADE